MILFDPISVAAAHQRALVVGRQLRRAANTNTWGNGAGSSSSAANISGGNKAASGSAVAGNNRSAGGIRCFGCGEVEHRQSECKKTAGKRPFSFIRMIILRMTCKLKGSLCMIRSIQSKTYF